MSSILDVFFTQSTYSNSRYFEIKLQPCSFVQVKSMEIDIKVSVQDDKKGNTKNRICKALIIAGVALFMWQAVACQKRSNPIVF